VDAFIRHRLTDYDRLLKVPGLTREEARMLVAEEVRDTQAAWRRPPEE
jgi:hypothetical protein